MKWTKQRKIGAALVTLAGMAFGADQLFFSGGSESGDGAGQSAAAAAAPAPLHKTSAASPATAGGAVVRPAAFLARRLEQAAAETAGAPVADAFKPPVAWFPKPPVATTAAADKPAPAAPTVDLGAQFKARHKLIGVMRSGRPEARQGLAVISGPTGTLTVRVGQAVSGAVLKAVDDGSIVMNDAGQDFVVELPRPGFSSSAGAQ